MTTSQTSTKYTLAQVKYHNKADDLWVIINNRVYDLSKYRDEHPGGSNVLEEAAGKNATKEFNDIGHSKDAIKLMKRYCIGEIVDEEKQATGNSSWTDWIGGSALGPIGVLTYFAVYTMYRSVRYLRSR